MVEQKMLKMTKRTGEVIENTGSGLWKSVKRTGNYALKRGPRKRHVTGGAYDKNCQGNRSGVMVQFAVGSGMATPRGRPRGARQQQTAILPEREHSVPVQP